MPAPSKKYKPTSKSPKVTPRTGNKHRMLFRYGLVAFGFVAFAVIIGIKLSYVSVISAADWKKSAAKQMTKDHVIDPERGNILAANGNILACNITVYDVLVDLRHPKFKEYEMKYKMKEDSVHALADSLDKYYPRITITAATPPDTIKKYSWHTKLTEEMLNTSFPKRRRALMLVKKGSLADYERIRKFPIFRGIKGKTGRIPLYSNKRAVRQRPFGSMAGRSIGRVNEDSLTGKVHGYSGLEKDLDTLLYGKPGRSRPMALTGGLHQVPIVQAQRGYDILTTIDIDIQDVLEDELLRVCEESNAEWGTAIIMEVKTGEIKAISNIQKLKDGTYGEGLNRAVQGFEPGSVMKPISMMIAMEDGVVKSVNDQVDTSPFQRTSDPHAPTVKNMKQVIAYSSNTGIARLIFRKYAEHPEKFYDRLASIDFFEPMHTGIAGEQIPRVRRLVDKTASGQPITMTSRHLDLARQAYGYNTEIPPIYTLSYYNAIANGGEYIRPHLVKALRLEGQPDSILPVYKRRICSENTARMVRECIHDVVWDPHGTARRVQDDRVNVVGKTGTAFPVFDKESQQTGYDKSKRRFAFAGFFPYEQPKYSCMALVLTPAGNSAAATSGQVLKNVALKLYARGMLSQTPSYTDSRNPGTPVVFGSKLMQPKSLINSFDISNAKVIKTFPEVQAGKMPNVTGYDVGTALKILERLGLNVSVNGWGCVTGQSIPAGQAIKKGQKVTLQLGT